MLFTRKGDDGTSGLFGVCDRFLKDDAIFWALGTVDELNSLIGVCYAKAMTYSPQEKKSMHMASRVSPFSITETIRTVQNNLFIVQAELAGSDKTLTAEHVSKLEAAALELEKLVPKPTTFIIAGATELSAFFDFARTVARRAERCVITVQQSRPVSAETLKYLNRLSSLLYILARYTTEQSGVKEQSPMY